MIISIASGKGGTGKTTVATALAQAIGNVQFLDCDVEEPNAHLFLKPERENIETIYVSVPEFDRNLCTYCGECGKICQFHAIVSVKKRILLFPQLCHSCGGCIRVCPSGALKEAKRETGVIESGRSGNIEFLHGILNIGEAKSPPLIKELKKKIKNNVPVIIDCPPGTSCPVVASLKDTDFILLVTEPTPFGLNDLKLAVELVRSLNIPFSVIINRSDTGDNRVKEYCISEHIDVSMEIRDDRKVAEGYSRGDTLLETLPELKTEFIKLFENIKTRCK
ncbi:MAG: ATP-binding protein [Candidatus Eremiobacterota bacterium]